MIPHKYILRDMIPGVSGLRLVPGVVFLGHARIRLCAGSEVCFPVVRETTSGPVFWVPAKCLLSELDFLKRQPVNLFWAAAWKREFYSGRPCYITDPFKCTMGKVPFRFESIGELNHFLVKFRMNKNELLLSKWVEMH